MHRLAALLLLLPSIAFAQFDPLTLTWGQSTETQTFSPGDCNGRAVVNWTVNVATATCSELKIWVTSANCTENGPALGDYDLGTTSLTTLRNGTETIEYNKLPFVTDNDGGLSCGSATTRSWKVCGLFETPGASALGACGSSSNNKNRDEITLTYDGKAPGAPTITDAAGADGAIRVRVDVDSDTVGVRFGVRPKDDPNPFTFGDQVPAAGNSEGRIEGLTNGTEYEVVAKAIDAAGNESPESESTFATPVRTAGFFETYKNAGGQETGGCAAAPGLLGAAFVVVSLWVSRRRKS